MLVSKSPKELRLIAKKIGDISVEYFSNEKAITIAFDKWETVRFLEANGLQSPKTFIDLNKAKAALSCGELKFH